MSLAQVLSGYFVELVQFIGIKYLEINILTFLGKALCPYAIVCCQQLCISAKAIHYLFKPLAYLLSYVSICRPILVS